MTDLKAAPPRPRRRRLVVVLICVLLAAAAAATWQLTRPAATTTATTRTVQVTRQTIKDTVAATGTLAPRRRADLTFASSGTVTKVYVSVGDKVKKNDKLATIDDTNLRSALTSAKADRTAARSDLADLEGEDGTASATLSAAKLKVREANSSVADARDALAAATLRATFTGVVAAVNIATGDTAGSSSGNGAGSGGASSSASSSASSADITVISTDTYTVTASVGSADLAKVKKNLQVEITPTGSTSPVFGTVSSVAVMAASSTSTSSAATFPVTIDVTGAQKNLFSGASATVSIIVSQRQNVLTVAAGALSTENGKTVAHRVADGKTTDVDVEVGQTYGATTEVVSGLAEGDSVTVAQGFGRPSGTSTRGTGTSGTGTQQGGAGTGADQGPDGAGGPPAGFGQNGGQ